MSHVNEKGTGALSLGLSAILTMLLMLVITSCGGTSISEDLDEGETPQQQVSEWNLWEDKNGDGNPLEPMTWPDTLMMGEDGKPTVFTNDDDVRQITMPRLALEHARQMNGGYGPYEVGDLEADTPIGRVPSVRWTYQSGDKQPYTNQTHKDFPMKLTGADMPDNGSPVDNSLVGYFDPLIGGIALVQQLGGKIEWDEETVRTIRERTEGSSWGQGGSFLFTIAGLFIRAQCGGDPTRSYLWSSSLAVSVGPGITHFDIEAPDQATPDTDFPVEIDSTCPGGWVLKNADTGQILATGKGNKIVNVRMTTGPLNLRGEDSCDNFDTDRVNPKVVDPANIKPSISANADPANSTVLNASAKSSVDIHIIANDTDGTITKIEADFDGNGSYEYTVPDLTLAAEVEAVGINDFAVGTHHPKFRATDNDGATAETTITITVTVQGGGDPQGTLGYNIADDTKPVGDGDELNVSAEVFRTNAQGERNKTYANSELVESILYHDEEGNDGPAEEWSYSETGKIYSALDANLDGNWEDQLETGKYQWYLKFSDGTEIWIPLVFQAN